MNKYTYQSVPEDGNDADTPLPPAAATGAMAATRWKAPRLQGGAAARWGNEGKGKIAAAEEGRRSRSPGPVRPCPGHG